MKRVISLLILINILFVVGFVIADDSISKEENLCVYNDGTWRAFNDGCVDSCESEYRRSNGQLSCTQAITEGCDCGENQCWNMRRKKCEDNSIYNQGSENQINASNSVEKNYCISIGATWKMFNDECIDSCESEYKRSNGQLSCTQAITEGCDCGEDQCWNVRRKRCEDNSIYHQVVQEQNRLGVNQSGETECPSRCVCKEGIMICSSSDGNREIIINKRYDGTTIIKVQDSEMSTNAQLYQSEDGQIYGIFSGNQTKKIILPDEASYTAMQRIQEMINEDQRERKRINVTNENITLNEEGVYEYRASKNARLFWIFPVQEEIYTEIDAETGMIIQTRYSWWGFLARDVREDIPPVEGCETALDKNACCVNLLYDAWNSTLNKCVILPQTE